MAAKNISELIKSATEYVDYTEDYKKIFENKLGGDKQIYCSCSYGNRLDFGKLAENVSDYENGIDEVWSDAGIGKEQEEWSQLKNYCVMYVTDSKGNIIMETPKRYY